MFSKKEYFYQVYKERSFSKAAEKLFISQPSLSAIITKEEKKIGAPIFDRSNNPISLTTIGEKYIASCEKIFLIEDEFMNYISASEKLITGRLCIGSSHVFMSTILPKIISNMSIKYPGIQLEVIDLDSDDLKKQLSSGFLDLIIDNNELDEKFFESYPLGTEYLLLAIPKSLSINKKFTSERLTYDDIVNNVHLDKNIPCINISALSKVPFVLMHKNYDTRIRAEQIFRDNRISPHVLFEMNQLAGIFSIISSGIGASFISDTLIKKSPATSVHLYYYKINHPSTVRAVLIQKKKNKYTTPAIKEFIHIAQQSHTLTE